MNQKSDTVCLGVMISMYAGLRIGEICALKRQNIDLTAGVIHVRHTIAFRITGINRNSQKRTFTLIMYLTCKHNKYKIWNLYPVPKNILPTRRSILQRIYIPKIYLNGQNSQYLYGNPQKYPRDNFHIYLDLSFSINYIIFFNCIY